MNFGKYVKTFEELQKLYLYTYNEEQKKVSNTTVQKIVCMLDLKHDLFLQTVSFS